MSTQLQHDLSALYGRIGDIEQAQDKTDAAFAHYQAGLEITKKLAEQDPSNTQFQRDLSVSYVKLGDIERVQGNPDNTLKYYQQALAIHEKLIQTSPTNSTLQADIKLIKQMIEAVENSATTENNNQKPEATP